LLVVHAILVCSDVLLAPRNRDFRQVFITDLVALNLMLGVILLPVTRNAIRVALGAGLYILGWAVHLHWHPGTAQLALAGEILSGPTASHALEYGFPVLQWAGVFLVGTVLGEGFLLAKSKAAREAWAVRLIGWGFGCAVLALALKAVVLTPGMQQVIAARPGSGEVVSLFGKLPPSPLYLLLFGGLGACLIGLSTLVSLYAAVPRAVEWVTVFGRNSLCAFLLQSVIFRDVVARMRLTHEPWTWPFIFAAATAVIWGGARLWDRLEGNRWLTLGIGRVWGVDAAARRVSG
ncbi:MAG TPA: hypothetical protein VG692_19605, partial [Gemmatimonadales bacterium]|nr:hypothetical protein [Gemmatimonadales bacterium]